MKKTKKITKNICAVLVFGGHIESFRSYFLGQSKAEKPSRGTPYLLCECENGVWFLIHSSQVALIISRLQLKCSAFPKYLLYFYSNLLISPLFILFLEYFFTLLIGTNANFRLSLFYFFTFGFVFVTKVQIVALHCTSSIYSVFLHIVRVQTPCINRGTLHPSRPLNMNSFI